MTPKKAYLKKKIARIADYDTICKTNVILAEMEMTTKKVAEMSNAELKVVHGENLERAIATTAEIGEAVPRDTQPDLEDAEKYAGNTTEASLSMYAENLKRFNDYRDFYAGEIARFKGYFLDAENAIRMAQAAIDQNKPDEEKETKNP